MKTAAELFRTRWTVEPDGERRTILRDADGEIVDVFGGDGHAERAATMCRIINMHDALVLTLGELMHAVAEHIDDTCDDAGEYLLARLHNARALHKLATGAEP